MSGQGSPIYRFGEFQLEPLERSLTQGATRIALTPKVFDTLVLLVERAGRLVSKDELMNALWPRGYVEEATLSNHIWQIRRALGDTAKSTRFVETVPKLGYRFAAPVAIDWRAGAAPAAVAPAAVVPATSPETGEERRHRPRFNATRVLGAVVVALCIAALAWRSGTRQPRLALEAAVPADRTVAFVGFSNLSQNIKDAWLGPALTAMLGAELSAADRVRVVPDELVRDAGQGLSAPLTGGYGHDALVQLRTRLGADYVVSGSYWVAAAVDDPTLRVDVHLQDARSGVIVATISNQAGLSALAQLVNQSGASLRDRLGVSIPTAAMAGLVARSQPPTTAVAQRIGVALDAMERHDAARARDELLEAVAQAPEFAPSYLYLSRAWSALGFREKALAAAEQAASRAIDVPPELKLEIDAAVQTDQYQWGEAAATWKSLVTLKPLTIEYRIDGVDAAIAMGDFTGGQALLADLRRLPQAAGDPRVDLAAARLARARNDAKEAEQSAARALTESQGRAMPALAADAGLELANARTLLGHYEAAASDAQSAISAYRALGNPHGESAARRQLAAVLADQNQIKAAHEEYSTALGIAQRIGDAGEVGAVYRNIASLLWVAGDLDGTRAAARQALASARETGDLPLQAWTLRALATIAGDDAASDEVMAQYAEVTELTERAHDRGGHVWSLATNADELRLRGDLDSAHDTCERAMTEAAALTDPQFAIYSTFICAQVAFDRGETDRSKALLERVEALAAPSRNPIYAANAQLVLGQIEFESAHREQAVQRLQRAAQGFSGIDAATGEADAEALLAVCAEKLGDAAARDSALSKIRTLRAAITARQEIYFVDIALAQLDGRSPADAVRHLHELALDAARRHFVAWSLEARLAEWRLLASLGKPSALEVRVELESEARRRGFKRILGLLKSAPAQSL